MPQRGADSRPETQDAAASGVGRQGLCRDEAMSGNARVGEVVEHRVRVPVAGVMGASVAGRETFESQDLVCKLVLKFGGH